MRSFPNHDVIQTDDGVVHDVCGVERRRPSRWRAVVASADESWVIHESSAVRIEVRRARGLGHEGESADWVAKGVEVGARCVGRR